MSWSTILSNLESLKMAAASVTTDTSTEAENVADTDRRALTEKIAAIKSDLDAIQTKAEKQRQLSEQELLKITLNEIRADKEHTEKVTTDAQGFITSVLFESERVVQKIEQLWLYSDATINRRGQGTTLKAV